MRRIIILAAVLAFTFFFASQAVAQDFYIGVKFGLSFQDIEFNDIAVDFENESDTIFGFRIGTRLKNLLPLELSHLQEV